MWPHLPVSRLRRRVPFALRVDSDGPGLTARVQYVGTVFVE
jgi:hypothetical protein